MTGVLHTFDMNRFIANVGSIVGATVYFYYTGTTNLAPIYINKTLTTPSANPFTVAQGALTPQVFLDSNISYRRKIVFSDGTTYDVDPIETFISDLVSSSGAANVGYGTSTVKGALDTLVSTTSAVVTPEQYGAVGNGSTDDYTAFVNAIAASITRGVPLVCNGSKTYAFNQDTLTFGSGAILRSNGATFKFIKNVTTGTPAVSITGPFTADSINVSIPAGTTRHYGILATGNDVNIPKISIVAGTQQAQLGLGTDYAVRLYNGYRFNVDKIVVTNYDRTVTVELTDNSRIGGIDVTSYIRGLYTLDNVNLYVGKSKVITASPNALPNAGHNSVLFSRLTRNQENVTIEDFVCGNAGEHSIRMGGSGSADGFKHRNIYIVRPRIFSAGRSGIKLLATDATAPVQAEYNENIFIIDPVVEDSGNTPGSALNECGILVQRTNNCTITNPIIRPSTIYTAGSFIVGKAYIIDTVGTTNFTTIGAASNTVGVVFTATGVGTGTGTAKAAGYFGIRGQAFTNLNIINPSISGTLSDGLYFSTDNSGESDSNSSDLTIIGGSVSGCGDDGLTVSATSGFNISDVTITDTVLQSNTNRGFVFAEGSLGTLTNVTFRGKTYRNGVYFGLCSSGGVTFDLICDPAYGSAPVALSKIAGTAGSIAKDGTSLYALKGTSKTAGSFTIGNLYTITTIGSTDFTSIGATTNTVGLVFTATGAGAGTGTAKELNWTAL